ncbi:glycoside hydrolase family 88 protein [Pedobacter heparinus]|uniref:Glycosyl hydrolase family 88 n=1 Tax=Pedobacter heparinus (strain ATCC 13125 / DSM 2366 / CIP 104194 / JCM 7457 / NBRC 12017 / NCIMB 9290 / NRRL B-14731 / HIM 762-3) TaxID=485917 RepID=C6XV47_PEDHD|nr:glycoside hydrolase family 88 protein [Pedobacter heparinus]ACU06055.1 glycosyl hydrolase family 88 [Pedobacter heparinus DSM 2366]
MHYKLKTSCFVLLFMAFAAVSVNAQKRFKPNGNLLKAVKRGLNESALQYHFLMEQLPAGRFPVTYYSKEQKMITSGSEPWVGGFYPGGLLYLYESTRDTALYNEALRKLKLLEKEQFNKTTHDLGFMMYCSFGNARRLMHTSAYDQIIINSAKSLSSRYNDKVGCIRSWDSDAARFMVIIDNMVNLELLFAATKLTGDSSYYHIAVKHANTTMKHHYRADYSSYHLVIYNPETGAVSKKQTVQGAADTSAWARGQAWGLYGYTVMYRETKDKKYLDMANHIAQFLLGHPNLPKDKIPYWDFNAAGIPNAPRDASAGAVICSALIELAGYAGPKMAKTYFSAAETMLGALSSPAYRAATGENGGFILKHGVGNYPRNADIDVPLIYADYYYIEALSRYQKL